MHSWRPAEAILVLQRSSTVGMAEVRVLVLRTCAAGPLRCPTCLPAGWSFSSRVGGWIESLCKICDGPVRIGTFEWFCLLCRRVPELVDSSRQDLDFPIIGRKRPQHCGAYPGAGLHIYHLDVEGVPVARYLDNVMVSTIGSHGLPAPYAGDGPLNVLGSATNLDPNHSDSVIEVRQLGHEIYNFAHRAHTRAQIGELCVLESVP